MVNQVSARTDKALNQLSQDIGKAVAKIQEGTMEKDTAWESVFESFKEHDLEGKYARFIASDGFYLQRQERKGSVSLNEKQLYQLLLERYGKAKADRVWNSITIKKVDSIQLEAAIQSGKIDGDMVKECLTTGNPTYARVREEWTKEDKERAAALGIQKEEAVLSEA